jgi:hypothetical protein
VTVKALAGSVRRVQPPPQPPAKKACKVASRVAATPPTDVVEVADGAVVEVGAGVDVDEVDEAAPLPDDCGRVEDEAALGEDEVPQPVATDATATSDALVTTIRTDVMARG